MSARCSHHIPGESNANIKSPTTCSTGSTVASPGACSVEQQIQTLAVLMKDMVRSEIGTILTEMQISYEQGISSVQARVRNCNVPNTNRPIR